MFGGDPNGYTVLRGILNRGITIYSLSFFRTSKWMPTTDCGDATGLATFSEVWVTFEAVPSVQTLDKLADRAVKV